MKPSTGAAVRLHRNAVRDRPESLSAFKWNACPPSPEYPPNWVVCDLADNCKFDASTIPPIELLERKLSVQIDMLMQAGKRVLLILPSPIYPVDLPNYLGHMLI